MTLQEILFGTFHAPAIPGRAYYIDGTPPPTLHFIPKQRPRRKVVRIFTEDHVIPYLNANPGSSIDEIAAGTGILRKSIATAMAKMVAKGLVERDKRARSDGKMKVYAYWVK